MGKGAGTPDAGAYASERYNPNLPHCGALKITFDGRTLSLSGGTSTYKYKAVSGRPDNNGGFDYSRARQRLSGIGPIPEGIYWIRPDELWENAWYRVGPYSAWGEYRISIHPFTTTETFGRGGFFIHGGDTPGSAGCIDLVKKIKDFIADLKKELDGKSKCQIHVKVDYSGIRAAAPGQP